MSSVKTVEPSDELLDIDDWKAGDFDAGTEKRKSMPQNSDSSAEPITPKRARTSFWPSRRSTGRNEGNETGGNSVIGTLESIKAGIRSPPVEIRIVCKDVRAKYLKLVVLDSSGERTVKAFRECIAQFKNLEINKVYKLSGFLVQPGFKDSPDEIVLNPLSTFEPINRENFKEIPFDFKGLSTLVEITDNDTVDVRGIVVNIEQPSETSKGTPKQDVLITDETKTETVVTLFKNDSEMIAGMELYSPILIRFATKKTQFMTNSETGSSSPEPVVWVTWRTQILKNPAHKESEELINWFRAEAAKENIQL